MISIQISIGWGSRSFFILLPMTVIFSAFNETIHNLKNDTVVKSMKLCFVCVQMSNMFTRFNLFEWVVLMFCLHVFNIFFYSSRFPKRRARRLLTSRRRRRPSWRRWLTLCSSTPFASLPSHSAKSLKPCSRASVSTKRASRGWEHTPDGSWKHS